VLASLLVGLSRVASDSEVIALEAAGIHPARLLRPAVAFGLAGGLVTLAATAWWGPMGARTLQQLRAELAAGQASTEVRAGVFDERFPNFILYVQNAEPATGEWRGVFLAHLADPDSSGLTLAESAVAVPEPELERLRLHLTNGSTHSYSLEQPEKYSVSTFAESVVTVPLPPKPADIDTRRNADLGLAALWRASQAGPQWHAARADFHRRLALPAACVLFALASLPLGLLARRSGRPVGFVAAVLVAIAYYFVFLAGDRLAREGKLLPVLGVWLANAVLLLPALLFFPGRRAGEGRRWFAVGNGLSEWVQGLLASRDGGSESQEPAAATLRRAAGWRLARTLDLYVVRGVLFYSLVLLAALVVLFSLFTVLELVDEIAANKVSWGVVARFLWYLQPQAVYWMTPLAFLLGLLVELALLGKRNELVAMRGAGISLYRVALPVVLTGLAISTALFALDYYHLPYANQRQEMLRNHIKGRPPQTFVPTAQRWIFGQRLRIYHYAFYDPVEPLLGRVSVLEFEPGGFSLGRRIFAQQARWSAPIEAWVFEQGWERLFQHGQTIGYKAFHATSFPELNEPPAYFQKEVRESSLMNFRQLDDYLSDLRQAGFDVTRLAVQWHKKFSFPLIAAVIVLLAFPFGVSGERGAVSGLAVGIGLGFAYWGLTGFFEAVGNFGLLPPGLAAWGPTLAFGLAGAYLSLQIET
jgi:LPS export ABC transporter permease LptG/LPS export ABC transporter permease LptF